MTGPQPWLYAWSVRLWLARRLVTDPVARYKAAEALQRKYDALADEAGRVKMEATVELATTTYSVEATAEMIGRPVAWVTQVIRVMNGMEEPDGTNRKRNH